MTKEKEEILIASAKDYFKIAKFALTSKNYNSAVVLFFKSLVTLTDIYILRETGQAPSSHTSRFRISEDRFPEIYNLLDRDFPFYQDSYNHKMSKELAEVIKDDTEYLAKKLEVNLS